MIAGTFPAAVQTVQLQLQCTIIIENEVFIRVTGLRPDAVKYFYDKFSFFIEGARYTVEFQMGTWDGRKRLFDTQGRTYLRFVQEIVPYLVANGYQIAIDDQRAKGVPAITKFATTDQFGHVIGYKNRPMSTRPYQVDSVNELLAAGDGFLIAGTGAGKTLITAAMSDCLIHSGIPTVIIVPSSDLVGQTVDALLMCQIDTGRYDGESKDLDHPVVVATWQALRNTPTIMSRFMAVIVDEAHGAIADTIQLLICEYGTHIPYRFGVTGTFPKPAEDQAILYASIGAIRKTITAKWLIDNGYLATIDITPIQTIDDTDEYYRSEVPSEYPAEKNYISAHPGRIAAIAERVIGINRALGNTLVLVSDIAFGKALSALIPGSTFMAGTTKTKDRKTHYDAFEHENGIVKICTFGIAKQGISIDRVFALVMIDTGKSFTLAIQSIGRGLRLADDKNHICVFDIYSSLKYGKKHRAERFKFYKDAEYPVKPVEKLTY